jgi:CTP synthase (UTP-ammonia lyase)
MSVSVALVGDYDERVVAHQAIPMALEQARRSPLQRANGDDLAKQLPAIDISWEWIPTASIENRESIAAYDGIWCVPGSPYRSMAGALTAIRYAREQSVPFLGTCGGFQHAVIEYARNVLGWANAEHGETAPKAERAVIAELRCALVEATESVRLFPGTRIAAAYGKAEVVEGYRCSYGLNPEYQELLVAGPLRAAADDATGAIRAVELTGHPFYVATLFQPERAALRGDVAPLVREFVRACGN